GRRTLDRSVRQDCRLTGHTQNLTITHGRMVHDMYLVEVKTPEESADADDLFRVVRTIPAEEAFRPLSESVCPLVTG
ncbi:hypothetical protein LL250_17050, partial [Halomonas meridiana]|nr:hypothetical protein [Halomonas meridiana]